MTTTWLPEPIDGLVHDFWASLLPACIARRAAALSLRMLAVGR